MKPPRRRRARVWRWTVFGLFLGLVSVWGLARVLLAVEGPTAAVPPPALGVWSAGMSLRETFDSLPGAAGDPPSELQLLTDNAEAWARRWELLAAARERIEVSYFILKQDVFGLAFLGHLLHKAEQGVQVRVLLDALGTRMSRDGRGADYLQTLVAAPGVEVKVYRPLFNRYRDALLLLQPAAVLASDHDKILVIDGQRAMIGGRNISVEYFASPRALPTAFHDADLLIRGGPSIAAVSAAFEAQYLSAEARRVQPKGGSGPRASELGLAYRIMDAWLHGVPSGVRPDAVPDAKSGPEPGYHGFAWLKELYHHPELRGRLPAAEAARFRAPVRIVDSYPRLWRSDPVSEALIRLVESARREILIQSPYLVLPERAVEVLARAGRRGVAITILTNSPASSDNPLSQAIFLEQWPALMARIPGLRLYGAGGRRNRHSKMMTVDGKLVAVGTYNLDPLSMAVNGELMAVIWSESFAARAEAESSALIAAGPPGVYRYRIATDPQGEPVIAFGPQDHTELPPLSRLALYSWLVREVDTLLGVVRPQ